MSIGKYTITSCAILMSLYAESSGSNRGSDHGPDFRGSQFIAISDFSSFTREEDASTGEVILRSRPIETEISWDQLVVSWNANLPSATSIQIEACAIQPSRTTKFYSFGRWTADHTLEPRESVKHQEDQDGDMKTDTLVLKQPAQGARLRVRLRPEKGGSLPKLAFIGLSFLNSAYKAEPLAPNKAAWGKSVAVPERSQMDYPPDGKAWCSPTCTSMVLAYWSEKLARPELNRKVPEVAAEVYDRNWPGTGNWPFNTAFAGSFPGIRAYVTRFTDVSELESWILYGLPVVISVSYSDLKGSPTDTGGHLVVCVGFTEQGDVIVNDPGTSQNVKKTFPRQNLQKAWAKSKNTVYLIYPENAPRPFDRFRHWD